MSKTQLLSVTKNLYIARKDTQLFDTKMVTIHIQIQEQVVSRNGKQEVFSMLHFWRQLHNKYTTAP